MAYFDGFVGFDGIYAVVPVFGLLFEVDFESFDGFDMVFDIGLVGNGDVLVVVVQLDWLDLVEFGCSIGFGVVEDNFSDDVDEYIAGLAELEIVEVAFGYQTGIGLDSSDSSVVVVNNITFVVVDIVVYRLVNNCYNRPRIPWT